MNKLPVTIWDSSAQRINEIERNLLLAASEAGLALELTVMSEIPLLGRKNLLSRIPALEIEGMLWTIRPFEAFTLEQCRSLLIRIKNVHQEK